MADELQDNGPIIPTPWEDEKPKGWELPGTPRGQEIDIRDAQQPVMDTLSDSFNTNTAAGAGARVLEDEAAPLRDELPEVILDEADNAFELTTKVFAEQAYKIAAGAGALVGLRAGDADYNQTEMYEELTQGIPFQYHDDIVGNTNLAAAQRARQRILDDMERGQRLAKQQGMTSSLALFAGSMVDVDLPLTFMTGGGFGAAKVARAGVKFSKAARLPQGIAKVGNSALIGANAGLQAGIASGAAQAYWSETNDWTIIGETALMGAAMGAALSGATRADLGLSIEAARRELHSRIAADADNLYGKGLNPEAMPTGPIVFDMGEEVLPGAPKQTQGPVTFDSPDSTVGAAQVGPMPGVQRVDRAKLDASPEIEKIIEAAEDARHNSGWLDRKRDGEQEWLESFITGPASAVAKDYARLYNSESAVLNFLAGSVFESPHGYGRGRATAAILNDTYTRQIVEPTFKARSAMYKWAAETDSTFLNSGLGVSERGNRAFSREIQLEINARRQGRNYTTNQHVQAAADAYQEAAERALGIAKGREGQRALDGFEGIEAGPYLPYRWNGRRLRDLIKRGVVNESSVINALTDGYRKAGMTVDRDAEMIAKAVVTRMRSQADGVSTTLQDLMSADGREFLNEMLTDAQVPEAQRKAILQRITGVKSEQGKVSHAKGRNEVDLEQTIPTLDGSDLQLVDLLDEDINQSWHRYARTIAGSSALARQGITNRAMRERLFEAARKEQEALGEDVIDTDLLRAMFSHFDGGPIHGYLNGRTNKGLTPSLALAKRLTNLSLLGKLGITQLGETGAQIAAVGLRNWADRAVFSRFEARSKAENKELLDDLAFITGRIGEDHMHFAPHLELDDVNAQDAGWMMRGLNNFAGKAQWAQGYTSVFNQVRTWQQTTAAVGIADKVVKAIKDGDEKMFRRIELDFGLDKSTMDYIGNLIDQGVIELKTRNGHEYIHRLNMKEWDVDMAEEFGAGITRSVNQQVQKSLAGEQDAWIHNEAMSLLMHLKTFPLQAITKQAARNMRFMDSESLAALGTGMATAYATIWVRDLIDGRERSAEDRAKAAFGYSNMTGFIPMVFDPAATALGFENLRFNQYGPHSEASVASLDVANRAMRLPGAIGAYIDGSQNGYDRQAVMSIPFMNTMGISRLW